MTDQIASAPPRTRVARGGDWLRWFLVASWLAVLVAIPLTGERTASWSDVKELVASGKVDAVRVSPEMEADSTGYSTIAVHWERGVLSYVTEVLQVRGDEDDPWADEDISATLRAAPSAELAALQPGLTVTRDDSYDSGERVLGFELPGDVTLAVTALMLLVIGVLVAGREPWRATRWAWFWLLWMPVVGALLFALLSGPFPGIRAPKNPARRLTGGWVFLVLVVLSSVTISF